MRKLRTHIQEGAFHREVTIEGLENAHATKMFASGNETVKNSDNTQVNFFFLKVYYNINYIKIIILIL